MPMRPPVHHPPHGSPAQIRQRYDRDRGTSDQRGYDRAWRRLRLAHLMAEPLCRFCHAEGRLQAADVVDHILTIADRPDLRLDDTNLRSLCAPHHNALTASQTAAGHVGMRAKRR